MGTLTNGKFWIGVIAGVVLYYVYQTHIKKGAS
jgi:hypothetical protein